MDDPQEEANIFYNIVKKAVLAIFCILIILICLCFSSCTRTPEERRDRRIEKRYEKDKKRFAYLLKKHPEFIDTTTRIDTIVDTVTVNVYLPAKINKSGIDSLLTLYCNTPEDTTTIVPYDSNKVPTRREVIKQLIYAECTPEKIIGSGQKLLISGKDTVIVNFKGDKNGLNLSIVSISQHFNKTFTIDKPCPDPNYLDLIREYFVGLLIAGSFFLFLGFYLGARRRRNK